MGCLHGFRNHRQVARPKVFSVGREVLLRPRLDDEVERLLEAFPALFLGYLVSRVVDRGRPAPHPELQTAIAEDVGDGRFFGDLHRAVQGKRVTAVPRRILVVRCAAAASTMSGSARIEKARLKWSSPSHTVSKPRASPSSICARRSWYR